MFIKKPADHRLCCKNASREVKAKRMGLPVPQRYEISQKWFTFCTNCVGSLNDSGFLSRCIGADIGRLQALTLEVPSLSLIFEMIRAPAWTFVYVVGGLSPKIADPTRTMVLPSSMAKR